AGNLGHGVVIVGAGAASNRVQGNFIGLDVTGLNVLPNAHRGVDVIRSAGNLIGGNGIARHPEDRLARPGARRTAHRRRGTVIGTDRTGTVALGTGQAGVFLSLSASNNTVGGTTAAARNVLSGNASAGVAIADAGTTGNVVAGNFIGTDVSGTR